MSLVALETVRARHEMPSESLDVVAVLVRSADAADVDLMALLADKIRELGAEVERHDESAYRAEMLGTSLVGGPKVIDDNTAKQHRDLKHA